MFDEMSDCHAAPNALAMRDRGESAAQLLAELPALPNQPERGLPPGGDAAGAADRAAAVLGHWSDGAASPSPLLPGNHQLPGTNTDPSPQAQAHYATSLDTAQAGLHTSSLGGPGAFSPDAAWAPMRAQWAPFEQAAQEQTGAPEPSAQNDHAPDKTPADASGDHSHLLARMGHSFGEDLSGVSLIPAAGDPLLQGGRAVAGPESVTYDPAQVDPATPEGHKTLGHELAHVVQKRRGHEQPDAVDETLAAQNGDGPPESAPNQTADPSSPAHHDEEQAASGEESSADAAAPVTPVSGEQAIASAEKTDLGHRAQLEDEANQAGERAVRGESAHIGAGARTPRQQFWDWKGALKGVWNKTTQVAGTVGHHVWGGVKGFGKAGWELLKGIPQVGKALLTAEGRSALWQTFTTKEGLSRLWHGIRDPYVEAWSKGEYGEAIGRGVFDIGSLLVGTKGAEKVVKGLGIAGKTGRIGSLFSKTGRVGSLFSKTGALGKLFTKTGALGKLVSRMGTGLGKGLNLVRQLPGRIARGTTKLTNQLKGVGAAGLKKATALGTRFLNSTPVHKSLNFLSEIFGGHSSIGSKVRRSGVVPSVGSKGQKLYQLSSTQLAVYESHFGDISKLFKTYNGKLNVFQKEYWRHVLPHYHIYNTPVAPVPKANMRKAFEGTTGVTKQTRFPWE